MKYKFYLLLCTLLANLKIICQFHAHSVHQNSVEIFWAEIYRGRLLTLITGSSSRLLRIRFSADLTMYWFPVYHFRCMKFKPLVIWIWNQNVAISTIVGTSSHIKYKLWPKWFVDETYYGRTGVWTKRLESIIFIQTLACLGSLGNRSYDSFHSLILSFPL